MTKESKIQKVAASLNAIDDALFQKMAEDVGFCEELISTVLERKVQVLSVTPQNSIKNLQGRSVVLDALCILEDGKTIYHIDRTVRETGEVRENGLREIYVNAKIDDGSDVAKLMRIFKEQNTYDFEKFPRTSKRKKQFIENEGGKGAMCEAIENLMKEEVEEVARGLFENGADYELVRKSVTRLSDDELMTIYEEVKKK